MAREMVMDSTPEVLREYYRSVQSDLPTEEMVVNMGPQHPSTHGVLRMVLRTDGEMVQEAIPHLGYLHRCAEKIGESLQPFQYVPYTDRMDYVAGMNNNQTWALAIEKLAGLEVPPRAQAIRVIFAELNRIASHLVSVGSYGLDMGAFTPFLYCFREREMILDLFEATCGARLTYSYITPGGVTQDLPEGFVDRCREFLDYFEPKILEYNQLLSWNHIFVKRTSKVGVISLADALAWGLTGVCLRASGIRWDLRKVKPYDGYEKYDFEIPIGQPGGAPGVPQGVLVGDSWNRYFLRLLEMEQCVRIIRQALDQLPDGDVMAKKAKNIKLPDDEVYVETENPRGQMGFYVRGDGSTIPARVKARGPCFCNLSIATHVLRDILIADIPAIFGSIDVVMGDVDR
ncbi:MAG TPA: NADH-quinone oxidoreductase subunit D [Phycisphaerae bacterium]|nr:NADH-quinone oxidoreductase subunit D [Phycisphaerae bacterium]HNU46612.1 NADH-quinone oxidoreductase subunit D [Phycisphaerae bacterium]